MTVSNAFSRPDQLSATLRERILHAAQDLGYVGPDPAARALARGTTGAVGVLLTESLEYAFTDLVATSFLSAIAEELAPTGLALTLLTSSGNDAVIPARDVAIDGALVFSCDPTSPALGLLTRRRLPLVLVDQDPIEGFPCVNVADRSGARAAAQHVVDLGHRRVGLVVPGQHGPYGVIEDPHRLVDGHAAKQRMLGWLDVLQPAGVHYTTVRHPNRHADEIRGGARLLLDRADRPTAMLCFSDAIAYRVIQAAGDLGLRVPADLTVVGFDDHPSAAQVQPALTTVRQDVREKGRRATAALTEAITRARAGDAIGTGAGAQQILLPTELIIRDSSGPAPANPPAVTAR